MAIRSDRLALPVLIWPALVATAMSAMVASSVSPERWLMTAGWPGQLVLQQQLFFARANHSGAWGSDFVFSFCGPLTSLCRQQASVRR